MVVRLLALLRNGQKLVQEGALTAMASLADAAKGHFAKYYDQVCTGCCIGAFIDYHVCCCAPRNVCSSRAPSPTCPVSPTHTHTNMHRNHYVHRHLHMYAQVLITLGGGWQVMPLLRQILGHANDKSHQMLRAKALECISLVGMAIGRDRFREDAHAVLRYMQSLQVCSTSTEHWVHLLTMEAQWKFLRTSQTLGVNAFCTDWQLSHQ